jgi:hypothetical protein
MIDGGKGGAKTKTGLEFESRVNLRDVFSKIEGYSIKGNDLFWQNNIVASLYKKNELYAKFLSKLNVKWAERISKKLLPDETIFVLANKTLFIVEMKFQKVSGSVDEKLQTCDFKKKQYTKLFKDTDLRIEYCYILSDWFKNKSYKDTLDYIESVGCRYFFGNLPFNYLGLSEPMN